MTPCQEQRSAMRVSFPIPIQSSDGPQLMLQVDHFCGLLPGALTTFEKIEFADPSIADCRVFLDKVQFPPGFLPKHPALRKKLKYPTTMPIVSLDFSKAPLGQVYLSYLIGLCHGPEPFFLSSFLSSSLDDPDFLNLTIVDNCLETVGGGPLLPRLHIEATFPSAEGPFQHPKSSALLKAVTDKLSTSGFLLLVFSVADRYFGFAVHNEPNVEVFDSSCIL